MPGGSMLTLCLAALLLAAASGPPSVQGESLPSQRLTKDNFDRADNMLCKTEAVCLMALSADLHILCQHAVCRDLMDVDVT
jgi:hypothetical protein